jgi:hypothetical protein
VYTHGECYTNTNRYPHAADIYTRFHGHTSSPAGYFDTDTISYTHAAIETSPKSDGVTPGNCEYRCRFGPCSRMVRQEQGKGVAI